MIFSFPKACGGFFQMGLGAKRSRSRQVAKITSLHWEDITRETR